jgi:hypothetical protein
MTITIEIPDNVAASFAAPGRELAREVLEAFAREGYRSERLTRNDVRNLLSLDTLMEVDGFLKEHELYLAHTVQDFEKDRDTALLAAQHTQAGRRKESSGERLAG